MQENKEYANPAHNSANREEKGAPDAKARKERDKICQIYDRMFKKVLTLSNRSIAQLINGLFGTDYPPDITVAYHWTEHHDDDLKRTLADTILTINGTDCFHIEAQMYKDEEIEFRVFDYSYKHALNSRNGTDTLKFPEPQIIYLYRHRNIPDQKEITLDFGRQGTIRYRVPVFKLQECTLEEVEERKLLILLPFLLLRFRDRLQKKRTPEDLEALRSFILNDILGMIIRNQEAGNLTAADANRLRSLVRQLYNHLYSHYEECKEGGLNDIVEEAMVLDADILEKELEEKVTKRVTKDITKKVTEDVTKKVTEDVTKKVTKDVTKKVTEDVTKKVTEDVTKKVTEDVTKKATARINQLCKHLIMEHRQDALLRAIDDSEFQERLLQEYGL